MWFVSNSAHDAVVYFLFILLTYSWYAQYCASFKCITNRFKIQFYICNYTYVYKYLFIVFFRFYSTILYYTMLNIVPCAIEWTGFLCGRIFNVAWFLFLYLGEIIWPYLQIEADIGLDLPSSNSKDTWDFSILLLEALYFLLLKLGQIFPTSLIFLVLFWFSVCFFFLLLTDTFFFAYKSEFLRFCHQLLSLLTVHVWVHFIKALNII